MNDRVVVVVVVISLLLSYDMKLAGSRALALVQLVRALALVAALTAA
tara:strand:+ start:156 stop:296 length:141 start_codon:yes stop_codon:yes gene_type:complete